MAELDGSRVAAVLAADTKLDVRAGGLTELASHLNAVSYTHLDVYKRQAQRHPRSRR